MMRPSFSDGEDFAPLPYLGYLVIDFTSSGGKVVGCWLVT
jgi:hypothetical protein